MSARSLEIARSVAVASYLIGLLWIGVGCAHEELRPSAAQSNAARPTTSAELFERGATFARAEDSARAEQYMTLAVAHGYPAERAIRPLVEACLRAGRLKAALDHATMFLERHPSDFRLRLLVAALEAALGRPSRAVHELERVLAEQPSLALAHYQLGVLLFEVFDDASRAKRCFRRYLAHDRHGPFADQALAYLSQPERIASTRTRLRARVAGDERGTP